MKIPLVPIVLVFLIASGAGGCDQRLSAPNFSLISADGEQIELLAETRQRPQLLLFWATWCPYCRALMPHLQSIQLEHGEYLNILAINFKEDGDPAAYLEKAGLDFVLLPDGDGVAELYGIEGTPGLILVDRNMQVRFDLRELPILETDKDGKKLPHGQRAKLLAPYWAAELRKAIRAL